MDYSPSQEALLAELECEYRRLEELARRAPRIHALINEADNVLDRLAHKDKRRLRLEVWLIYLNGVKDAGWEITSQTKIRLTSAIATASRRFSACAKVR